MLKRPLIIGHRGAAALLPENTLESFHLAFEKFKADAVEFDVHFSRDRMPVIIHDATLERTTNGRGFVAQQTFEELRKLDAGNGFRIPSLEEVFSIFKTKTLLVEIKDKSAELVHSVMALIRKHKADQCIVGSKHALVASTLCKHYPQQTRFLSQREIVQNFIAAQGSRHSRNFFSGIHKLTDLPAGRQKISGITDKENTVASMPLERCGMRFDSPEFLDWLHRKEIKVYFWILNDPEEIKRLAGAGADGIITDHPGIAAQALKP